MSGLSRSRLTITLALALLATGACASRGPGNHGGPPGGPGGPGGAGPRVEAEGKMAKPFAILITGMDTDHDLIVTTQEFATGVHTEWLRLDRDNSGGATGFEVADWATLVLGDPEAEPGRLALDLDFSLTVTPVEFENGMKRIFSQLDRNGDARITRDELLVQIQTRPMGGPGGGRGPGGGGFPGGGGRGPGGPGGPVGSGPGGGGFPGG